VTVKLRLMRMGKKKQPTYRIVVADSRSPRDGRFIETVGTYAPREDPSAIAIDNARALGWLVKGAQPTETVRKLLKISGAWEEFEASRPPKKTVERPARASKKTAPAKKAPAKKAPAKSAPTTKAAQAAAEVDAAAGSDEGAGDGDES
jgi:small subunit ribosomal protein S16